MVKSEKPGGGKILKKDKHNNANFFKGGYKQNGTC